MRIKRGVAKRRKHKKVLKLTKGFTMSNSKLIKRAREALLHSGQYSMAHRRKRAGQFRNLWIQRINAALTPFELSYSKFIAGLKNAKIELNRKVLADLALDHKEEFKAVVESLKVK